MFLVVPLEDEFATKFSPHLEILYVNVKLNKLIMSSIIIPPLKL
jgi:hypothetical protein